MDKTTTYKKLYRSKTNRVILGILGGLGEYFDVDPVLLRFVYVLITIFSGFFPGIIVYFFGLLIIPERQK
ncbi:MAG TPA: PspC domain-containing protein [Patescibacteria group bacterium]